ncbi:MAG: hypothetical protein LBL69_03835 [Zoogloeaceae bacterium]|nr:hypothetical protein [Zoogloeaceae bacterium]
MKILRKMKIERKWAKKGDGFYSCCGKGKRKRHLPGTTRTPNRAPEAAAFLPMASKLWFCFVPKKHGATILVAVS